MSCSGDWSYINHYISHYTCVGEDCSQTFLIQLIILSSSGDVPLQKGPHCIIMWRTGSSKCNVKLRSYLRTDNLLIWCECFIRIKLTAKRSYFHFRFHQNHTPTIYVPQHQNDYIAQSYLSGCRHVLTHHNYERQCILGKNTVGTWIYQQFIRFYSKYWITRQ